MIQAKELRIGNKALYKNEIIEVVSISGIKYSFNRQDIIIHTPDYQAFTSVDILKLSPIPLTPELLEKCCGFKKATEYIYDHKSGIIFDAPNDWNNPNNYPIGIDCSRSLYGFNPEQIIIRTLTLHDLQNKFYSITGEELEVDLTALQ